jgi:hypothetical protein
MVGVDQVGPEDDLSEQSTKRERHDGRVDDAAEAAPDAAPVAETWVRAATSTNALPAASRRLLVVNAASPGRSLITAPTLIAISATRSTCHGRRRDGGSARRPTATAGMVLAARTRKST